MSLGVVAQAQSIEVSQDGDGQQATVEQSAAPGSAVSLGMRGSNNSVFIRQVGGGNRATVSVDGSNIGQGEGRSGSVEQQGENQLLRLTAEGDRIGYALSQQGSAANRLEATLKGDALQLEATQISSRPEAPQLLNLVSEGSGHSTSIAQTASEGAADANRISLAQSGSGHRAALSQNGAGNEIAASQKGSGNTLRIAQTGDYNQAEVHQEGNGLNTPTITQSGGAHIVVTYTGH